MHVYDSGIHLNLSDIALDSITNPTAIRVTIKQSQTDPFRRGINIFLGCMNQPLCPGLPVAAYLAIRSADPCPLFIFQDGTPLSRDQLVKAVLFAQMQHRPSSIQRPQLLHWCGHCGGSMWNSGGDNKDAREIEELCIHPLHVYPDT